MPAMLALTSNDVTPGLCPQVHPVLDGMAACPSMRQWQWARNGFRLAEVQFRGRDNGHKAAPERLPDLSRSPEQNRPIGPVPRKGWEPKLRGRADLEPEHWHSRKD